MIKTANRPCRMTTGFSKMNVNSDLDVSGFCGTTGRVSVGKSLDFSYYKRKEELKVNWRGKWSQKRICYIMKNNNIFEG